MINFLIPAGGYQKVVEAFVNPILRHLSEDRYTIDNKAKDKEP